MPYHNQLLIKILLEKKWYHENTRENNIRDYNIGVEMSFLKKHKKFKEI